MVITPAAHADESVFPLAAPCGYKKQLDGPRRKEGAERRALRPFFVVRSVYQKLMRASTP